MDEILPGLYLGDAQDAVRFHKEDPAARIICVLDDLGSCPVKPCHWFPIYNGGRVNRPMLDLAAEVIMQGLVQGEKVLIHCGAGIERSPLAVAWFLYRKKGMASMDAAYSWILQRRPKVQRRDLEWGLTIPYVAR